MSDLCIHLKDDSIIENLKKVCPEKKYKAFVEKILAEYFNNRIVQLKMMGIDGLAEYTCKLEKELGKK